MPMQIRRTPTVNNPPTGLSEGQLAVEMAGVRPNLWVGVPTSIDPSGRRLVNSTQVVTLGVSPPSPSAQGDFWWDTNEAQLYMWTGAQWVIVVNQPGIQGPPGPAGPAGGTFPDVATAGAYLRESGDWVPMTAMQTYLAADVNSGGTVNIWANGPTVNVGNVGTWYVSTSVTMYAGAGGHGGMRIWDGTTIIASGWVYTTAANAGQTNKLAGIITNPAGPLTFQFRTTTAGVAWVAQVNGAQAGNTGRDSSITAIRIG